jgi:hypothetical protein
VISVNLETLLSNKKSDIVKKWRDLIVSTYPANAQRFLKKEKNRFANPVGQNMARDLEVLFDGLIKGGDAKQIVDSLDNIIRVRAVQDFTPSQAIGFILGLKGLVRDALGANKGRENLAGVESLEKKIDDMMLMAFDIYVQCRQRINEIRINEVKTQVGRLMKRANLTIEIPDMS